jgi:hypothetical protein
MKDERSSVERLKDKLYSRTSYTPPEDDRSPVTESLSEDVPENWNSPDLDTMIEERRQQEARPSKMKKFFLISTLFFIGAFILAIYVYLVGGNFVSTKNVDIKITGPAVIEAGQPLSITASVENNNNTELQEASLSIQYPEGTRKSDDPTMPLTRDRAELGGIRAGSESTQTFRSVLYGQKGEVKTLKLNLEYKIKGSNVTFYKDKTFEVAIGDTPVAIGVERPSEVTSGDEFTMRVIVASNSSDVLKGVVIKGEYPYGYTLAKASPLATTGDNLWSVGDLAPGDKKTITLTGTIAGVDEEERTFRFYAGLSDPESPSALRNALVSTTETIRIDRPSIGLSMSMNGDSTGDYIAPAGSTVSLSVRYQNNSTEKLTNVRVAVKLTGPALDKSSIRTVNGGFYDSGSGLVVWQPTNASELSSVDPGESGNLVLTFASLSNLPTGKSQQIDAEATVTGSVSGISSLGELKNTASKSVKISSTVNFSGKALYSRGPYKNVGPLPPKADATTTYTVVFDLGNTQNEVIGGKVTAHLGPNVKFLDGGTGNDKVTYDETSNMVTWDVGTLASGAGFSAPLREAVFQVALRPSIGQIGTVPSLVSGIYFTGTDAFTNVPVNSSLQNITTKLTSDSKFVQGDDVVAK